MDPFVVIRSLAYLTVIGQVIVGVTIVGLLFFRKRFSAAWQIIARRNFLLALIVTFVATSGSLFFSEIAQFEPCKLCWFQRIAMYPQVVLFATALWMKEYDAIRRSCMILCSIGSATAIFHYTLQMSTDPAITDLAPCSLYGGSCTEFYILQFGYITIPMMALTAFVLILLLMFLGRKQIPKPV